MPRCLLSTSPKLESSRRLFSSVSIKGFGSLSIVGTDTNTIGFYRDRSQAHNIKDSWGVTPDSRLGLQLDVNFNQTLQMTLQWVTRDHAGDFFEQNLEWAFLRWHPLSDLDIRVGCLGTDVFLSSDYRNLSYSYPWMRPPYEFYGTIPIYHYDGFDTAKRYTINNGYLTLKMFAGYSTNQLISNPGNALFDFNAPVAGGNLTYEYNNWRTKLRNENSIIPESDLSFDCTAKILRHTFGYY